MQESSQNFYINDRDLINEMQVRMNQSLAVSQTWRQAEVMDNYAVFQGDQWLEIDSSRQNAAGAPIINLNRVKPVLDSIVGFEIQNRQEVKYLARRNDEMQTGFTDVVENVIRYQQESCNAVSQWSLAFQDMLICGIGAVDTVFDYNRPPHNGDFKDVRIFPGFLFWDPAARARNFTDSDFVTNVRILDKETIKNEFGFEAYDNLPESEVDARILQFFSTILIAKQLGVVYEYQWRRKEPIYRVSNPFKNLNSQELIMNSGVSSPESFMMAQGLIQTMAKEYGERFSFVPDMDEYFTIMKKEDYNEFRKSMEFLGVKTTYVKQSAYKYYRAIVVGDRVISKDENFTQEGFSITFMTANYSELGQFNYGLMRFAKTPQRLLNQVVSDYSMFLSTIPKGGVNIEEDAVSNIPDFLDSYVRAKYVTIFRSGALSGGKVQAKIAPPLPQGMMEWVQYTDAQILQVCGVTPELMGMMNTKEQNAGFLRQQIKQGLTTLSTFFDPRRAFVLEKGRIYIDCVRVLCENSEGRLVRDVIGESGKQFIPMLRDNVAAEYDIVITEMPTSPDERKETFDKLMSLAQQVPQALMMALSYSDLPKDEIEKLKQAMQPPPPPQPDPMVQETLKGELEYKKAQTQNLLMDAAKKQIEMQYAPRQEQGDIDLKESRAMGEIAKVHRLNEENQAARLESKADTKEKKT